MLLRPHLDLIVAQDGREYLLLEQGHLAALFGLVGVEPLLDADPVAVADNAFTGDQLHALMHLHRQEGAGSGMKMGDDTGPARRDTHSRAPVDNMLSIGHSF